ncbi:MAG: NYN domain-containing protein [Ilumatobacteraceae bacterium]|jgi:hypothetical protein
MVDRVPPSLPDRELRKAIKFALGMAHRAPREGGPEVPSGLRTFLLAHRDLRDADLGRVRGLLEANEVFRAWVGSHSSAQIAGEAGHLWLSRPEGWQESVAGLVADSGEPPASDGSGAERRRREAAEAKLAQLRTEVEAMKATLAAQGAELAAMRERLGAEEKRSAAAEKLAAERSSTARRGSGERDKAVARAESAEQEADVLRGRLAEAEAARDALLADAASSWAESAEVHRVRSLLAEAHGVLEALVAVPAGRSGARRAPQAIPGSAYGDDVATLQHLLKVPGIHVVIDGYNVAKLGWPSLPLVQQRDRCIDAAEGMASRWGTRIHVVFDGTTMPGASTTARRLVRVSFSPEGVLADDVIRQEVGALDASVPVLVVTNDKAILRDVKAMGANTVPSDAAVALARR